MPYCRAPLNCPVPPIPGNETRLKLFFSDTAVIKLLIYCRSDQKQSLTCQFTCYFTCSLKRFYCTIKTRFRYREPTASLNFGIGAEIIFTEIDFFFFSNFYVSHFFFVGKVTYLGEEFSLTCTESGAFEIPEKMPYCRAPLNCPVPPIPGKAMKSSYLLKPFQMEDPHPGENQDRFGCYDVANSDQ